jgi:hypothetical protein
LHWSGTIDATNSTLIERHGPLTEGYGLQPVHQAKLRFPALATERTPTHTVRPQPPKIPPAKALIGTDRQQFRN